MMPQAINHCRGGDFKLATNDRGPNPATCRAKPAGFGDYVDCLTESVWRCPYALSFGGSHLCLHPKRNWIVNNTKPTPNLPPATPCPPGAPARSSNPALRDVATVLQQLPGVNIKTKLEAMLSHQAQLNAAPPLQALAWRIERKRMEKSDNLKKTTTGSGNGKTQTFTLAAPTATSVQLVGDFTSWQQKPISMQKGERGIWHAKVELTPGEHHYRFLVDGQWHDDPYCALHVPNPYGSQNAVCRVS